MEADQVDVLAATVFRHFEKVENTEETRSNRQRRSNVRKTDGLYGIDLDLTVLVHRITATNLDMRTQPDPHAAGDVAVADSFS